MVTTGMKRNTMPIGVSSIYVHSKPGEVFGDVADLTRHGEWTANQITV